jgi:hypothetical protein
VGDAVVGDEDAGCPVPSAAAIAAMTTTSPTTRIQWIRNRPPVVRAGSL